MIRFLVTVVAIVLISVSGCATPEPLTVPYTTPAIPPEPPPEAPREFRAAWIATVANIDWPSAPGLTAQAQQAELRALLDQAVEIGLNGVVFQVRPMADALYASELEPWSSYLTGVQGQDPGYDPLMFAVEEAHRRGLELHAWFNPFRAGHPTYEGIYDPSHVRVRHPDWVHTYGSLLWLDPGVPEAREHSLRVMLDVVARYDVDGIHLDDYFYPYPVSDASGPVDFPDHAAWTASGYEGTRSDWRRANVDEFVQTLYGRVKALRPEVKVGISPFGIWRPGYPEGIEGFDQYEGLYADARHWLREGWVDYFTPQLYWALDSAGQPYGPLLDWWIAENLSDRHIWPGNYASRIFLEGSARWEPAEIVRQVLHTRATPGAEGNIHFSMKALMPTYNLGAMLRDSVYAGPAIVPETSWLGGYPPGVPVARWEADAPAVSLTPGPGAPPFVWQVREWMDGRWALRVVPGTSSRLSFGDAVPGIVVVSAVSRLGRRGPPAWAIRSRDYVE